MENRKDQTPMNMNIQKMMKQAQQLQKDMVKQQEELANKASEPASGGGMVTAKVNGKGELLGLQIEADVVNKDDITMLQDLIVAAVNEANRRVQESVQGSMSNLMGGMKIPGLF